MAPNTTVMQAVEQLGYRVTVGDVAAQAGLDVNLAQRELLNLASDVGGHLQVAESGEIAYLFPENLRGVLRNKFLKLRLKEWWEKVWRVLFYLIRISFGIVLVVSILVIFVAIALILIAMNSSRSDSDRGSDSGGGMVFLPNFWIGPNWFWFFDPNPSRGYNARTRSPSRGSSDKPMNFLEAIFSFLFGDGNPNADLEDRRWQTIGTVIRNNQGAVVVEQIASYLDNPASKADEDFMIPVLTRFNGRPEVSPDGAIIYHFPELQSTAARRRPQAVSAYLRELPWRFSRASSGQILLATGLGALNLIGALVLGSLLSDGAIAAQVGGFVALVQSIFVLLLGYGTAFLSIPLLRYFWIQWRNRQIEVRNQQRQASAVSLNQADAALQEKLAYARQFAAEIVVSRENLAYTTEENLLEQEAEHGNAIDAEWERRLNQSGPP
ncbi:MAG TPA: hypothetical protein V6D03_06730 [Candidatus Caenarcaniphilales bacterium]